MRNTKKNQKPNRFRIHAALVFLVLLVGFVLFFSTNGQTATLLPGTIFSSAYRFEPTDVSIPYDYDSQASFYSAGGKEFYFCTRNGIKYMDTNGKIKYEDIFTIQNPILIGSGVYAAVAEPKGKNLYLYSPEGLVYTKTYKDPIHNFTVNSAGYVCVILSMDDGYYIVQYGLKGDMRWEMSHNDTNLYPMSADVSKDGRIIAINRWNTGGLTMDSYISYAYVKANDATSNSDYFFGYSNLEKEYVCSLRFMDGNNLFLASDVRLQAIELGENNLIKQKWEYNWNNKIDQFHYLGDKSVAVILGEGLLNQPAEPQWLLKFFSLNGGVTGEYQLQKKTTFMSTGHKCVIIGCQRDFFAVNERGTLLWEYTATQDVKQLIFLDSTDTVLLVTSTEAQVLRKTKIKE